MQIVNMLIQNYPVTLVIVAESYL